MQEVVRLVTVAEATSCVVVLDTRATVCHVILFQGGYIRKCRQFGQGWLKQDWLLLSLLYHWNMRGSKSAALGLHQDNDTVNSNPWSVMQIVKHSSREWIQLSQSPQLLSKVSSIVPILWLGRWMYWEGKCFLHHYLEDQGQTWENNTSVFSPNLLVWCIHMQFPNKDTSQFILYFLILYNITPTASEHLSSICSVILPTSLWRKC